MAKSKIRYAKKDTLDADEFAPEHTTVMISVRMPGDVLSALKKRAEKEHKGYQTLMVDLLRAAALDQETVEMRLAKAEDRVAKLEKIVQELQAGLAA
jgi:uncharacterized protein (DUF4415 family)